MKLRTRLFLFGAALPSLSMFVATLVGGWLFGLTAVRGVDRALLAQAAVESVSLFDGPGAGPHLHLASSPIGERVRSFAPVAVVYDERGGVVATYPPGYSAPELRSPALSLNEPLIQTTEDGTGQPVRRLWMHVESPQGERYWLTLTGALDSVNAATLEYYRVALAILAVMVLLIWLSQSALAGNLTRRIGAMMSQLPMLEQGRFEWTLSEDKTADELSSLRAGFRSATRQLARSKDSEERFLANAAHELRTPLSLMRTRLDLGLRKPRSEAELREALIEARSDLDRLAELATRLLDWTHPHQPMKESLDWSALVRSMVKQFEPLLLERGQTFALQLPDNVRVFADRSELERVVANLFDNARKFAAEESVVSVALTSTALSCRLTVSNAGASIAPDDRERIFEPFVRGDPAKPGSGLGLALVRDIARRHGGRAFVSPDDTTGTTLVFEIPLL